MSLGQLGLFTTPVGETFATYMGQRRGSNCQECPLAKEGRKQLVLYRGDPKSSLVIIGEGPGEDEDLKGEPFVGRSGKLMDEIFSKYGIDTNRAYVTNVVKCRPSNNRTPVWSELTTCFPFLMKELDLKDKEGEIKTIITIGATALGVLTGQKVVKITQVAGIPITSSFKINGRARPVLPLLHTAYLLRNPPARGTFETHLTANKGMIKI